MSWYIIGLVTVLATSEPDIKVNMSVKFPSEQSCNLFLKSYKKELSEQLIILFPALKLRRVLCINQESLKEIQKQLYGIKT